MLVVGAAASCRAGKYPGSTPIMPTVPLSAYDRLFLAGHEALQRRGLPGHHCLLWLELAGRLDRAKLDEAYRRASAQTPLVDGRIAYSLLTARAHWRYGEGPQAVAPIDYTELSSHADPEAAQRDILLRAWRERQDPAAGQQLRLFCFEYADRTTLVLRFPHYLMDQEGALAFLSRIHDAATQGGQSLAPPREAPLPYPPDWSGRTLSGWWSGVGRHRALARLQSRQLPERSIDPAQTADYMMRCWSPAETARINDTAKKSCRPGPMLYTRHLIAATVRGLDDMADALGLSPGDHYLIPLPMLRPRRTPRTKPACNDVVVATMVIHRAELRDAAALDASLLAQINDYSRGGDEATWLFMSYVGLLRASHYRWMLMRKRMLVRYSLGFGSFRADEWPAGFLGSQVTNVHGGGLPPIPPGAMLSFTRYADRLNVGAAFFPHVCTAASMERLLARVEHHLGARN